MKIKPGLVAMTVAVALAVAPSASAEPDSRSRLDLTYATVGNTELKLDLYLPRPGTKPAPLVVYIHGGGWAIGSRKGYPVPMPWELFEDGKFGQLRAAGYAVASVDYRLTDQAQWPAQIHDVKAAVRWLRANAKTYHLDPDRVAAWGDSAGGHLAAMLGTSGDVPELEGALGVTGYSSRVQAVADWFGASDLLTMDEQAPKDPFSLKHDVPGSPEAKLLGCRPSDCPDKARSASPVSYVTQDDPPTLFQHGTFDHLVPFGQSEELRDLLVGAGVATEFHGYLSDHEFVGVPPLLVPPPWEIRGTLVGFLDRVLR